MDNGIDIDAIVAMLDERMDNGVGHVDVTVSKDNKDILVTNEVCCKNSSCCVPTLHKDID